MYLIVGLGNPGKEYDNTRHNIGFWAIDYIAEQMGVSVEEKKFKGKTGKGMIGGEKAVLLKPQTYMNLSGESIRQALDFYKMDEKIELIVLFDDVSLDVGQLRIRKKGSAGGHNGLKSIISHLGHDEFRRIKIGVGEKPKGYDLADYVLGHFSKEEQTLMTQTVKHVEQAVKVILAEGIENAMNQYNKKQEIL